MLVTPLYSLLLRHSPHRFPSKALHMLVIFLPLFGVGLMHACPRVTLSSFSAPPLLARAPPGPSRVSWLAVGALGPHLHGLLPLQAPELGHALPSLGVASLDNYLSEAGLKRSSPSLAHAPLGASRVSWLAAGSHGPHPHVPLPHQAAEWGDTLPPSAHVASLDDFSFKAGYMHTSLRAHPLRAHPQSQAWHTPLQVPTSTVSLTPTSMATTPGVCVLHSRQLFGVVSVKRGSSVPPVTNPVSLGVAGGAKASTTFSTAGGMASITSGGEPSHLPVRGQGCGFSISWAPMLDTWPTSSPRVELSSLTTSLKVSTSTSSAPSSSSLLIIPHGDKVVDEVGFWPTTTTTSNKGDALPPPLVLTVRLLGLRASQPRCGLWEDGLFSNIPCGLDLPLHNVGVVYTSSYTSALLPLQSPTASIKDDKCSAQSSRLWGACVLGGGSFGSWAWIESTYMGLFAYDSSLTFHHCSVFSWAQSAHPPHWLAHFDYDLQFRRRIAYAFVPYHSKSMWSGLVKKAVYFWTPIIYQATFNFILGSHALAGVSAALENVSSSSISLLIALISNSAFLWHLLGSEICSSLLLGPLSFIFNHLFKGTRLPQAHLAQIVPHLLFWSLMFAQVSGGSAVCLSCSGNDPNCKGGSTCVLAMALAANALVMAGSVGAPKSITMGDDGKHILPLSWLQFLKPSVLHTLVSLANRAPSGTPLDLTPLTIQALSAHISNGSVSISEGRLEFLRRMSADTVSDADLLKMKTICEVLPQRGDDRFQSPLSRLSNSGALQFVFALASQIVVKLANTSRDLCSHR